MSVDYRSNFGIGVKIENADVDLFGNEIRYMSEYLRELCNDSSLGIFSFEVGSASWGGVANDYYICIKNPFKNGVFDEELANGMIEYLSSSGVKYEGNIDCVGGLQVC